MRIRDLIRRPQESSAVPPLDGPWTPNDAIEQGRSIAGDPGLIDALMRPGGRLVVLTTTKVLTVELGSGEVIASTPTEGIPTAFCVTADGLLVAREGGAPLSLDPDTLQPVPSPSFAVHMPRSCVTAMANAPDGSLWMAQGSADRAASDWKRDLLLRGASGSVWRAQDGECSQVKTGLAWPGGLYADQTRVIVSESWRHRLVEINKSGRATTLLGDLPAYPGQLTHDSGGFIVACPLPRSALVEFVMGEETYVRHMIDTLDERAWVAPQLATLRHPLEQVQGGELLVFGQVKPWAPTRSYGLVALMDEHLNPTRSLHSRANGHRHGIARALRHGDEVIVVSQGAREVYSVPVPRRSHVTL